MRSDASLRRRHAGAMILGALLTCAPARADQAVAQAQKPAAPGAPRAAGAPGSVEAARQAYDRGTAAFDAGRYPEAARDFAQADTLAPNPIALESALKAATLGDQPLLALELAERADARPPHERVGVAARTARERFAASAGKLAIRCRPDEPTCRARLDGEAVPVGAARWVRAGVHSVDIEVAGGRETFTVQVDGGAALTWEPPPPPEPPPGGAPSRRAPIQLPPPPAADRAGISPAFFWIGVGATAIGAGLTAWSGADTLSQYQAFQDGDDSAEASGRAAQLRTNVLLGVTGAVALGTAALGIWAVDWGPKERRSATLFVGPAGATLRVQR
jgi:hypothetical protein